jgi:zinc protease
MACLALCLAALHGPSIALAAPRAPRAAASSVGSRSGFDVGRWRLQNGLRVLFVEDRRAPLVTVNAFYHVGSRDEKEGDRGLTRLAARLLDGGAARLPAGARARLIGDAGGASSTVTADDHTAFQTTAPASQLGLILSLEAERLRVDATADGIAGAQAALREERDRASSARPLLGTIARLRAALFANTTYRWSASGFDAAPSETSVDRESLRRFCERHWKAANLTLVVVGDVRRATVEREIAARFAGMPGGTSAARPALGALAPAAAEVSAEEAIARPIVALGIRLPGSRDRDWPAIRVLAALLGQGAGGLLHARLVGESRPAVNAGAFVESMADAGVLLTFALPASDASIDGAKAALLRVLGDVARADGTPLFSAADVDRLKHRVAMEHALVLDTPAGLAAQLGEAELLAGDARRVNDEVPALLAVTEADVRRVAARLLAPGGRSALVLRPRASGTTAPAASAGAAAASAGAAAAPAGAAAAPAGAAAAPAAGAPGASAGPGTGARPPVGGAVALPAPLAPSPLGAGGPGPAVLRQRLDNGLEVQLLPRPEVPLVSIRLVVRAGAADEDPTRPGLASVTAALLRAGSVARPRAQLDAAFAAVGGTFTSSVSADGTSLGCTVFAKDQALCLDALAELALRPALPEAELASIRAQLRAQLRERAGRPGQHGLVNLDNLLFGDEHPLGRLVIGPHLEQIARDDVASFWRRTFRPDAAVLVVAGAAEPRALASAVAARFASWNAPVQGKDRARVPVPERKGARILLVDRDDTEDAALAIGQRLPGRADPSWPAALLLAGLLGTPASGGRLAAVLEARGLSADGAVVATAGREHGRLTMTATVSPAGALTAASTIAGELRHLREVALPDAEVAVAARRLSGQLAAALLPAPRLVEQLGDAYLQGVPPEAPWKILADVGRFDPAAVKGAASRLVEPENLVVVAEGRGDALAGALDAAKLRYERVQPRDPQSAGERARRRRALLDGAATGEPTKARALLRRGLDAQGGAPRLAAIKDMKLYKSGTRRAGDELADMFATVYYGRPDRFRLEQEVVLATGRTRQVVLVGPKGVKAGALGGALAPVPPVNERRMRGAVFEDTLLLLPHVLEAKPPLLARLAPPREVDGRKLEGAFVRMPSGEWTALYFDAVTHLLVRIEGEDEIGDPRVELLADYREVAGFKFPFRQISPASASGAPGSEAEVKEIKVNPGLPSALFE